MGFAFNADLASVIMFLDIGTRGDTEMRSAIMHGSGFAYFLAASPGQQPCGV